MPSNKKKKKSVYNPVAPAVEQAARLLMLLGGHSDSKMTLTEICTALEIHKSKGYSILNTLMQYSLIVKDQDTKTYSLGPGLIFLAQNVRDNLDIVNIARPGLKDLAGQTKACVLLGTVSNNQIYIASKYENNETMGISVRQYQSLHITHGAHGKAIFAFLDPDKKEKLIKKGELHFYGINAPVDFEELDRELEQCRKKGYAIDNGNMTHGIKAISSPIFSHNKKIIGVIILVGTFEKKKFGEYGEKVSNLAKTISEKMGAIV